MSAGGFCKLTYRAIGLYTDAMKYIIFAGFLWFGVFVVGMLLLTPFVSEVVFAQEVVSEYSVLDTVVVFLETFGLGFGGIFGVMWLIVRLVKGDLRDRMEQMEGTFKDRMEKMEKGFKVSIDGLIKRFEKGGRPFH